MLKALVLAGTQALRDSLKHTGGIPRDLSSTGWGTGRHGAMAHPWNTEQFTPRPGILSDPEPPMLPEYQAALHLRNCIWREVV